MADKKYKKDPITEAVCEFRFTKDTIWDPTIPGQLYEKVKKSYPNKEKRSIRDIEITQSAQEVQHTLKTHDMAVFLSKNRKKFIQVGQHLLAVNVLKPYPNWKEFRAMIDTAFSALTKTVEIRGIERIGLRYINRIDIEGKSIDLEEYFEFRPFLGSKLPQNMEGFFTGCQLPFSDRRDYCNMRLTNTIPSNPGKNVSFILDLDYYLVKKGAVKVNNAQKWVEEAHNNLNDVFEGSITQKLRNSFF